ncbi:MAG: sensor histidine kinase, partial [Nocardioidaceae bacterium]
RVIVASVLGHTSVTGLPTHDVDATVSRLVAWEVLVGLLAVVLAAVTGTIIVRRQMRPLRGIAATAQEVSGLSLHRGAGSLPVRVPAELVASGTEVGQVAEAMNHMLTHVEEALDARHASEQQVRQFLADASHELRTPLTTIQGYADLSQRADAGRDALEHAMGRVRSESARMGSLVDDLLLLARLDAGRPLEHATLDLRLLLAEAVNDARVVGSDHHWRLELPNDPLLVTGDAQRLHQVVANLLSNALRHAPSGTTVTTRAGLRKLRGLAEPGVVIQVHDDGPGLPVELQGKAFERFSRGDSSRTRASGGAGLGLSIVAAIVTAHEGSVELTSNPGDTTFTIVLPPASVRSNVPVG